MILDLGGNGTSAGKMAWEFTVIFNRRFTILQAKRVSGTVWEIPRFRPEPGRVGMFDGGSIITFHKFGFENFTGFMCT